MNISEKVHEENMPTPSHRGGGLAFRVIRAGAWTLGAHSFDLALSLVSNLILTRLLYPDLFGLMAAASAPIIGLTLISDFGVHTVIVQSARGANADFLRSAWTFQLGRGLIVWAILIGLCISMTFPTVRNLLPENSAFAEPLYPYVAGAMGFGLVLSGAESTSIFLNYRRLTFGRVAALGMISRAFSLLVIICGAIVLRDIWALVIGGLANGAVRLILSHTFVPGPKMRICRNHEHIAEIIRFGKWVLVSSLASFVVQQSDVIAFGFLFSTSTLGVYAIAKLLVSAAEGLLERLNSSLALPLMSEVVRTDATTLSHRYYRFRLPIDLVAAITGGILFVTGPLVVSVLYDPRYSEAGVMLRYLAIGLVIYPFQLIRSAFTAIGRPQIVATVTTIQAVCLAISIGVGYRWFGEIGAIVGIAAHRTFPALLIIGLAKRRGWTRISAETRIFLFFLFGLLLGYALQAAWNGLAAYRIS